MGSRNRPLYCNLHTKIMLNNNTVNGLSIYTISSMFIAKVNEKGVTDMGDDFFTVHDCIHWFTGLGVSIPEEKLVGEIQKHFTTGKCSPDAAPHVLTLMKKGVYAELRAAFLEAKENMTKRFS